MPVRKKMKNRTEIIGPINTANEDFAQTVTPSVRKKSVYGNRQKILQPSLSLPKGIKPNRRNKHEGVSFLKKLQPESLLLCFFDPQYRGVLDHQNYGNEGERQRARSELRQMSEAEIKRFLREIDRVLMRSGHLLLWTDKFHLCTGLGPWLEKTNLDVVDLIVWNKLRMGMGYRSRRVSEYLVVLQKAPRRAKGVWSLHDIRDVWDEKVTNDGPHAKPIGLQSRLIEALTNAGDIVIDPAAGSYSILKACARTNRQFLGCDIRG